MTALYCCLSVFVVRPWTHSFKANPARGCSPVGSCDGPRECGSPVQERVVSVNCRLSGVPAMPRLRLQAASAGLRALMPTVPSEWQTQAAPRKWRREAAVDWRFQVAAGSRCCGSAVPASPRQPRMARGAAIFQSTKMRHPLHQVPVLLRRQEQVVASRSPLMSGAPWV